MFQGNFKGVNKRANQFNSRVGFGSVVNRAVNESCSQGKLSKTFSDLEETLSNVFGENVPIKENSTPDTVVVVSDEQFDKSMKVLKKSGYKVSIYRGELGVFSSDKKGIQKSLDKASIEGYQISESQTQTNLLVNEAVTSGEKVDISKLSKNDVQQLMSKKSQPFKDLSKKVKGVNKITPKGNGVYQYEVEIDGNDTFVFKVWTVINGRELFVNIDQ